MQVLQIFLVILIFGGCTLAEVPKVKCPLTWEPLRIDGIIASNTVETHHKEQYVAALKSVASSSDYDLIGRYDVKKGIAYAVNGTDTVITSREFLLLYNPWQCNLEWLPLGQCNEVLMNKFGVSKNARQVGRKELNGTILGGAVGNISGELAIFVSENGVRRFNGTFQVLISYSPGLNMKIVKIKYEKDPYKTPHVDIMGLDIVKNEMDTEVSYTVIHTKEIDNSYYFWERKSTTVSCGSWFNNRRVTKTSESEESSQLKFNITVIKTVTVAKFQSVEVCTAIKMSADDFKSDFNAEVEYSSPGLSSKEVLEHLRAEMGSEEEAGYFTKELPGGIVSVSFNGTFEGPLSSEAETRVSPLGDPDGCVQSRKKIMSQGRDRFLKMKKKLLHNRQQKSQRKTARIGWDIFRPVTFTLYNSSDSNGTQIQIGNKKHADLVPSGRKTVFLTHGFRSDGDVMNPLKDEILKLRPPYNVIVVDWSALASVGFTPIDDYNYLAAKLFTKSVGRKISEMAKHLISNSRLRYDNLHIMGHSLGAHVAGYAGDFLCGKAARITGLDPAGPLFDGVCFQDRLDPTDGKFVDVIHTDGNEFPEAAWNGFGYFSPLGDIDFYPNGGKNQPESGGHTKDHERAVDYMKTSIISCKDHFVARRCNNYEDYPDKCNSGLTNQMGFYASNSGSGSYYLDTNTSEPYCLKPSSLSTAY